MLIHVTPNVLPQGQVREQVLSYLVEVANNLMYDGGNKHSIRHELKLIWDELPPAMTTIAESNHQTLGPLSFEDIEPELVDAANVIKVKTLNGTSKTGFDYAQNPDGISAIVIGGAKLRGV